MMEFQYLIPVTGLCLFLWGGYMCLSLTRKHAGMHPVIKELLNRAVDQRSVMLVEFPDAGLTGGRFFGPCTEFDEKTILLDVYLHNNMPEWLNESVRVNFKIDNKSASSYYQFTSRLRGLPRRNNGFGMLLDTPVEILPNQRRSFVRVAPPGEATYGVGVWQLDPTQARPNDPASLGVAPLRYRQDRAEQLALLNISVTGLALKLKYTQEQPPAIDPQSGDRLLCLLMLRSSKEKQTMPFWLDCTVMNRAEKEGGEHIIIGLRFGAWAVLDQSKGLMDWFAVGEGGAVGPLGAWILRQQMTQMTQKNYG